MKHKFNPIWYFLIMLQFLLILIKTWDLESRSCKYCINWNQDSSSIVSIFMLIFIFSSSFVPLQWKGLFKVSQLRNSKLLQGRIICLFGSINRINKTRHVAQMMQKGRKKKLYLRMLEEYLHSRAKGSVVDSKAGTFQCHIL